MVPTRPQRLLVALAIALVAATLVFALGRRLPLLLIPSTFRQTLVLAFCRGPSDWCGGFQLRFGAWNR
jgi:hypothetical protein